MTSDEDCFNNTCSCPTSLQEENGEEENKWVIFSSEKRSNHWEQTVHFQAVDLPVAAEMKV